MLLIIRKFILVNMPGLHNEFPSNNSKVLINFKGSKREINFSLSFFMSIFSWNPSFFVQKFIKSLIFFAESSYFTSLTLFLLVSNAFRYLILLIFLRIGHFKFIKETLEEFFRIGFIFGIIWDLIQNFIELNIDFLLEIPKPLGIILLFSKQC